MSMPKGVLPGFRRESALLILFNDRPVVSASEILDCP